MRKPIHPSAAVRFSLGAASVEGTIGSVIVKEQVTSAAAPSPANLEVFDICANVCSIQSTNSVRLSPLTTLQTTLTISLSGGNGGALLQNFAADDDFML
jgi:hypothetical protein